VFKTKRKEKKETKVCECNVFVSISEYFLSSNRHGYFVVQVVVFAFLSWHYWHLVGSTREGSGGTSPLQV